MKRRLLSLVLILAIILTYIPMDAELVLADIDFDDCPACGSRLYYEIICDNCGYHDKDSGECGEYWHCSLCDGCIGEIGGCYYSNICLECVESEGYHCVECGDCYCPEEGANLCGECFRCENCVDICSDCGFCEDCAYNSSDTHCKICGQCYSTVGDCVDGDSTHCEDCCKVCEECGECLTEEETEFCDVCGLCIDCCLANAAGEGCTCEEYCVESSEWASHICDNCGKCFDEQDQCETCGYCLDCCESVSECSEGLCVEDDDYEDHFCEDCGRCFDEVNECDSCISNGELRCEECCEEYRMALGCDCSDTCVSDSDFEDHLTEVHSDTKGRAHTKTPQKNYSVDGNYHWYYCSFCNEEDHMTGKGLHSYNSVGECKVCGYKKGAAVYITMQPKDATSIVADYNDYTGDTDEDDVMVLTKTFSVKAVGKGKLSYQWYSMVEGATTGKAVINTSDIEKHLGNAKSGATSDTVEMYVSEDLCYAPIKLYCIVSDEAGHSVKSAVATLYGEHNYACITNIKDTSKSQVTYKYVTDNNVTKTVSYYPSLGHNYECTGDYVHSTNRYKYNNTRKHTYNDFVYLGTLYGDSNVKVYKKQCIVCNSVEYYTTHTHVWVLDEDDKSNPVYETPEGKKLLAKGHLMKCQYDGCDQTLRVTHDYKEVKTVGIPWTNSDGTDKPAGYYRVCKACEYEEDATYLDENGNELLWSVKAGTVILSGSDTKTVLGQKLGKAGNKVTLKYNAKAGDKKRCTGWKVTYYYLNNAKTDRDWISKDVTSVFDPTSNWAIKQSSSDVNTYTFIMPAFGEFGFDASEGGKMVFTPVEESCYNHSKTKIINQREVTCLSDGYTGDKVCAYCGLVIENGQYIECAHKHTGTLTLVPGTTKTGDCTKKKSGKYSYEGDYKCSACGLTVAGKRTKVHNNVVEKNDGVAATCTTTGLTNSTYCTACGKTVKSQRVIPVTHKNTKVTGAVASTCTTTGFSGKVTCKDCGALVDEGHYTKVLGHEGGTAICTAKKVCTRCGESYGAYAAHTETTLEQVKATLTTDGNSGDKVCSVCDRKLQTSEKVYKPETFTLSKTKYTYNGKSQKPTVTVKDSKGNTLVKDTDYTIKYKDNVNVGTASVTVTGIGNYEYSKKLKYSIKTNDGSALTYTLSNTKYAYDGNEKKPSVTIKDPYGNTLVKDTDYTVSYTNNTNVGTATATVTGIGNYSYTKNIDFSIVENEAANYTFTLSKTKYTYDGKSKKPSVTVKDSKGNTLVKDTDYTLSYKNNTNVGTASVTVTGKGNHAFTKKLTYAIKVNDGTTCTFNLSSTSFTYDGTAKEPTITIVNSASINLAEGTDFAVAYANNTNVGTATATVTGKGNYSFTKVLEFTIVGNDGSILTYTLSNTKYTYDGTAKKPSVTVKDAEGNTLVKDTDYTVSYKDNVNVGTATATVTGKGAYTYTKKLTYAIKKNDGAKCTFTLSDTSVGYDGNAKEPTVTIVNQASKTLVSGTDYTVAYSNNINVGTATVTVTGIGNYSFTKGMTFEITKGVYSVTVKKYSGTYDGKSHTITISGVKEGSTIEYRTSTSGAWTTTKPSRKAVGKTTVYFQITHPNYETISGSATITNNPVGTSFTTLTGVSKGFKAVWTKQDSQTTGYEIEYSTSSAFSTSEKENIEDINQTTVQISGLTAGKKYYVRIRTYQIVGDKYYYSAWSEKKGVTTKS